MACILRLKDHALTVVLALLSSTLNFSSILAAINFILSSSFNPSASSWDRMCAKPLESFFGSIIVIVRSWRTREILSRTNVNCRSRSSCKTYKEHNQSSWPSQRVSVLKYSFVLRVTVKPRSYWQTDSQSDTHRQIDTWTPRQTRGHTETQTDTHTHTDTWTDRQTCGHRHRQRQTHTDRQTDRQTDRRTDGQTDRRTDRQTLQGSQI